ncbi:hypothetical protein PRBEI_2001823000 [Prionailurus iriomotensis]
MGDPLSSFLKVHVAGCGSPSVGKFTLPRSQQTALRIAVLLVERTDDWSAIHLDPSLVQPLITDEAGGKNKAQENGIVGYIAYSVFKGETKENIDGLQTDLYICRILPPKASEDMISKPSFFRGILASAEFSSPRLWEVSQAGPLLCVANNDVLCLHPVGRAWHTNSPAYSFLEQFYICKTEAKINVFILDVLIQTRSEREHELGEEQRERESQAGFTCSTEPNTG